MLLTDLNDSEKDELSEMLAEFHSSYLEVKVAAVCTSDGFILGFKSEDKDLEKDKVAAVASTLYSMSNAISELFSESPLNATTIEAIDGSNTILMKADFHGLDSVICVQSTNKMSLAELRYITKNQAEKVGQL